MGSLSATLPSPGVCRITVAITASTTATAGKPSTVAARLPSVRSSRPAFSSITTKVNSTMMAPAYTIICAAARNSAPSSRYSTASELITTISDSALLMGCVCSRRLNAPARQNPAKTIKRTRCIVPSHGAGSKPYGSPIEERPQSSIRFGDSSDSLDRALHFITRQHAHNPQLLL